MKSKLCFAIVGTIFVMCSTAFPQQKVKAEDLYQEGLMQMEGRGNYQKAIDVFGQILQNSSANRRVSAKAQFQTGVCYEKLGKAEAQKAYERTIANYPDQADLVAQARARLSALSNGAQADHGPLAHRLLAESDSVGLYDIDPTSDGQRVAYVNGYDGSLHVRDLASGKDEIVAATINNEYRYSPRWSPDGKQLALMANDPKRNICVLKLMDVATHKLVAIGKTESHEWVEPCDWSSDGRLLLCASDRSFVISLSDRSVMALPDSIPWPDAMSPDGRYAAFRSGRRGKEGELFVQPVAGGPRQKIADCAGGEDRKVVWSPDGRAIAYAHTGGIWIVPERRTDLHGLPWRRPGSDCRPGLTWGCTTRSLTTPTGNGYPACSRWTRPREKRDRAEFRNCRCQCRKTRSCSIGLPTCDELHLVRWIRLHAKSASIQRIPKLSQRLTSEWRDSVHRCCGGPPMGRRFGSAFATRRGSRVQNSHYWGLIFPAQRHEFSSRTETIGCTSP